MKLKRWAYISPRLTQISRNNSKEHHTVECKNYEKVTYKSPNWESKVQRVQNYNLKPPMRQLNPIPSRVSPAPCTNLHHLWPLFLFLVFSSIFEWFDLTCANTNWPLQTFIVNSIGTYEAIKHYSQYHESKYEDSRENCEL